MRLTKRVTERFDIPNDPDQGFVTIKHLKINEVKQIQSKANQIAFLTNDKGDGSTEVKFDPYTISRMMSLEAVVGWGKIFDKDGNPLHYSKANVEKAGEFIIDVDVDGVKRELDFYGWIELCRKELHEKVQKETRVAEEN